MDDKASIILIGLVITLLCSCSTPVQSNTGSKLNIVTTTTMLYDLASIIGGEAVEVTPLMGPGIDPHLYQASAGDVVKLQEADVIIYNGLHLEGKMGELFDSLSKQGRTVVCIEEGINNLMLLADEENPEIYDPHIWFDVTIWKDAARYVSTCLSEINPDNSAFYSGNLEQYLSELDELNQYIKNRCDELPESRRILVTAHDAFRYFGNAYHVQVMGLQGINTDTEAGTADVSRLASYIADYKIQAVFVESSVPPKNIEALQAAVAAQGFTVKIGGELYSDSLGDKALGHNSYILMFKSNIDTIVNALQ